MSEIRQWDTTPIEAEIDDGLIRWTYEGDHRGGMIEISQDARWAYVSTDRYEGTAMFPKALIKDVIEQLQKLL